MKIKIEQLLGTSQESYIWMLCTETSQLCSSPIFSSEKEAINSANQFVEMFNDPSVVLETKSMSFIKKGLELITGGKS